VADLQVRSKPPQMAEDSTSVYRGDSVVRDPGPFRAKKSSSCAVIAASF